MTPEAFIAKWSEATTKERAAAQEHFIDLCRLLDQQTPNEADPIGEWYAFERGLTKTGGERGWADVWKRGCFGWEYKGKGKNLESALRQLQLYALALESPPLLIVSDIDTIEIHTAFQNAVQDVHRITLADIGQPEARQKLRWAFTEPEQLRPKRTRTQITEEAAGKFADLAQELRDAGHDPHDVAHFLSKVIFCLFAEDAGVLPHAVFTQLVERAVERPDDADPMLKQLFSAMRLGGAFGVMRIDWFNGGLYDDEATLPLDRKQLRTLRDLAHMGWDQMEPSIFGTLFERGLDPSKRSQLGAHYTDAGSIMRLVNPTIVEPLLAEWEQVKAAIATHMQLVVDAKNKAAAKNPHKAANDAFKGFLDRLRNFRVLDPACGSGNFLYLSLQALKDIEHRANLEAEQLGLLRQAPMVGPEAVRGIEVNSYAAELARVTVWIGEVQWMLSHGYTLSKNPILKPLDTIEERDAIMAVDGTEPSWPKVDAIVGNPPFLGSQKILGELGDAYVRRLRDLYDGRIPAGADLVTYWFEKARAQIESGNTRFVGLVATNSIRGGANREVLKRIVSAGEIFAAWSDEAWVNEGAAVRVSLICFAIRGHGRPTTLDGKPVAAIYADLSGREQGGVATDFTLARRLAQNVGRSFQGSVKVGNFDIPGATARSWFSSPNPSGKANTDVLRPLFNAMDITRRPRDQWIIDFNKRSLSEASQYELPFEHVSKHVRPEREKNKDSGRRTNWWLHGRTGDDIRAAVSEHERVIVTARVSKHRLFVWMPRGNYCDDATVTIARSDDVTFGILHSRFHELWSLRLGTWLGVGNDPRYTPKTTFDAFPFPQELTPDLAPGGYRQGSARPVAEAARELAELRGRWLNPPEWVDRLPEGAPGYPDRLIPRPGREAELKNRTLTNLYNTRPTWLANAHRTLDEAVAAAYGWSPDLSDDEILAKLLELNLSRPSAN